MCPRYSGHQKNDSERSRSGGQVLDFFWEKIIVRRDVTSEALKAAYLDRTILTARFRPATDSIKTEIFLTRLAGAGGSTHNLKV
jgi:hypothetical protein